MRRTRSVATTTTTPAPAYVPPAVTTLTMVRSPMQYQGAGQLRRYTGVQVEEEDEDNDDEDEDEEEEEDEQQQQWQQQQKPKPRGDGRSGRAPVKAKEYDKEDDELNLDKRDDDEDDEDEYAMEDDDEDEDYYESASERRRQRSSGNRASKDSQTNMGVSIRGSKGKTQAAPQFFEYVHQQESRKQGRGAALSTGQFESASSADRVGSPIDPLAMNAAVAEALNTDPRLRLQLMQSREPPPYHQPHNYINAQNITASTFQEMGSSLPKFPFIDQTVSVPLFSESQQRTSFAMASPLFLSHSGFSLDAVAFSPRSLPEPIDRPHFSSTMVPTAIFPSLGQHDEHPAAAHEIEQFPSAQEFVTGNRRRRVPGSHNLAKGWWDIRPQFLPSNPLNYKKKILSFLRFVLPGCQMSPGPLSSGSKTTAVFHTPPRRRRRKWRWSTA